MNDDALIGASYMKLVAGFAGAVVSLAFLKNQSRGQMFINVAGGCIAVVFVAPAITDYYGMTKTAWVNLTTFGTGLLSMSILAGVFVVLRLWRENPSGAVGAIIDAISRIRGTK